MAPQPASRPAPPRCPRPPSPPSPPSPPPPLSPRPRAFTLLELAAAITASIVVAIIALPMLLPGRHHHGCGRFLKDSSHIRGIVQGMVIWAGSNKDQFPLPSAVDLADATVPEAGAAKDTTANILSLMIYQGYFPVELTVSPSEVGNIERMQNYQTSRPAAAVDPARALWDPAFSADFTAKPAGNTSYAHASPIGLRQRHWSTAAADGSRAIFGNRGPQVTSVPVGPGGPVPTLAITGSNTLRIHGPRNRWHGNIGYQDNHVELETEMAPDDVLYTLRGSAGMGGTGALARDNFFYDEPDDAIGDNNFLTITIPAAGVGGGKAIWD